MASLVICLEIAQVILLGLLVFRPGAVRFGAAPGPSESVEDILGEP